MDKLFVFVEGFYDKKFFDDILSIKFQEKLSVTLFSVPYQIKKNVGVNNNIKHLNSLKIPYIFISDLDSHSYPCITSRKEKRKSEYSALDLDKIIIVNEEIESWFISGVDSNLSQFFEFDIPDNTEDLTKEDIDKMIEDSHFISKKEFLFEISRHYDFDLAIKRNNSLKYFLERFNLA